MEQIGEWNKSGEKYSIKNQSSQLEIITIHWKYVCLGLRYVSQWTYVQVSIYLRGGTNGNSWGYAWSLSLFKTLSLVQEDGREVGGEKILLHMLFLHCWPCSLSGL